MWIPREKQKQPDQNWYIWLIMAGRGFGKTRTGAETILELVRLGKARRIALIGQTIREGYSVMARPIIENSDIKVDVKHGERRLLFQNGAEAEVFSGDRYEQLRGPEFDACWIDEFAKFKYPELLLDQVLMALRLGKSPKCIITTTPRPIKILHDLANDNDVVTTTGSTFENENLSPKFIEIVKKRFENTRWGAQELHGELLPIGEGDLWKKDHFVYKVPESLTKIFMGIDPAITTNGAETGIIIAGCDENGQGYVLHDLSGHYAPDQWARRVIDAYYEHNIDKIVVEVNQGGAMIEAILKNHDPHIKIHAVHARHGKFSRAVPIADLYYEKRIFHTRYFKELEYQMLSFNSTNPRANPTDRLDALVWVFSELLLRPERRVRAYV